MQRPSSEIEEDLHKNNQESEESGQDGLGTMFEGTSEKPWFLE